MNLRERSTRKTVADDIPAELPPIFEDDAYVEPTKPKATLKGAAIVSVRIVAGLVGLAVAGASIAAATILPLPVIRSTPPSKLVTPVATGQQLVCAGSLLRLADARGQGATISSPLGNADVRSDASVGTVSSTPIAQSDASNGGLVSAPIVLSTPPNAADPGTPILVAGAQSQTISEPEFAGLAAVDCGVAGGDSWLAGGSTVVGRTTLLTLSNPTAVPATVDLAIFGESGPVAAPGTSGIVVPADGQRVLSLAGFAPNLISPVVHVVSRGGQVVANLQQTTTRGLDPGGVDVIGTTTAPALRQVIPGVVMSDLAAQQAIQTKDGYGDLAGVLRLFVPGTTATRATISIVAENGSTNGSSFQLDLDAGRVIDLAIGDIPNGAYTVKVAAGQPIVAAVRISAVSTQRNDFAWMGASMPLSADTLLVVAAGPHPILHLANSATTDAKVTLTSRNGAPAISVTVKAGSSSNTAVQPGASYLVSGLASMFLAVTLVDSGLIAHYGIHPPGLIATPLRVYR